MAGDASGAQRESEFDTWFLGDQLAWSKYLPRAWRAVTGAHSGETFPSWINHEEPPRWPTKAFGIFEAYLHLLHFRLGWTSVGRGLLEWDRMGRLPRDPVLEFMAQLQGDGLDWFICWAASHEGLNPSPDLCGPFDMGGSDELHLSLHTYAPGISADSPNHKDEFAWPAAHRLTIGSLTSDDYVGWWNVLALASDEYWAGGIDVVVKPIGWLGSYHRSRATGIPHATSEDVHELGVDAASLASYEWRLRALRAERDGVGGTQERPERRRVGAAPPSASRRSPGGEEADEVTQALPSGVGVLEELPQGAVIGVFTEVTAYAADDLSDAVEVCVELIGEDPRFFEASHDPSGGELVLADEQQRKSFRLRPLTAEDGRWLSRFTLPLPVAVLETLVGAQVAYAATHDVPFPDETTNPIEVMEVLIGCQDREVFAVHYLQAVDFKVRDHYWLADDGWTDEFPTSDPRWVAEVADQNQTLELSLDDEGDPDEFEIWSNAETLHIQPWSTPALVGRWQAGHRIDRVMAELAERAQDALVCAEDLSTQAQAIFADEIESSPFVYAEAEPASKDLLALGPDRRMTAQWVLSIYEFLHDGNRA